MSIKNKKEHNYLLYLLKKIDKRYNKNIILFYDEKCNRANITEKDGTFVLTYGLNDLEIAKSLGKKWRYHIRYFLFHEMGHIIHNTSYKTFKEKVNAEYLAERFCLNQLKEMFPSTYKWACSEGYSLLQNPKWASCDSERYYRKAWSLINEYHI